MPKQMKVSELIQKLHEFHADQTVELYLSSHAKDVGYGELHVDGEVIMEVNE